MTDHYSRVIDFWFAEIEPAQWWQKDDDFDRLIQTRFGQLHQAACQAELYKWRAEPLGRLAEIIVLDQFSRNMYRDSSRAFACDAQALTLAQEAVALGADKALTSLQRGVVYLPYMHSESLKIHEVAVALYEANGVSQNTEFEYKHKALIERFGRYPHRNSLLGRASTPEELEYLSQPGAGF